MLPVKKIVSPFNKGNGVGASLYVRPVGATEILHGNGRTQGDAPTRILSISLEGWRSKLL